MIRYALGMDLALPDPTAEEPGGFTRESLLASVVRQVALDDDYDLRLVLRFVDFCIRTRVVISLTAQDAESNTR